MRIATESTVKKTNLKCAKLCGNSRYFQSDLPCVAGVMGRRVYEQEPGRTPLSMLPVGRAKVIPVVMSSR